MGVIESPDVYKNKVDTAPLCWARGCRGCCPESTPQLSESWLYRRDTHPACQSAWDKNIQNHDTGHVVHISLTPQTQPECQRLTPLWWSGQCLWPRGSNWWRGPCRTESCPRCPADAAGSLSACGPGWWSSPAASGDSRTKTGWRPFQDGSENGRSDEALTPQNKDASKHLLVWTSQLCF